MLYKFMNGFELRLYLTRPRTSIVARNSSSKFSEVEAKTLCNKLFLKYAFR